MLRDFAGKVIAEYGRIDYLINNAIPLSKGLNACTYDEFNYALRVGVTAPFFLTKLFMPYFGKGAAIVNISSSRDRMSQPDTESYTAAKGGIAALTHALAVTLAGKVRVNSISLITATTTLRRDNGQKHNAVPAVPSHGQGCISILWRQRCILYSPPYLKSEKQAGILMECSLLFMIGNAPFATVSNTAQSWTTKCLIRRSMPMLPIKRKT